MKIRSIFISDTHLGCNYCQAGPLLEFLKSYEPTHLYLVGDFIDGWKLKKNFNSWKNEYSFILRKIFSLVKHGTKVYYVVGNHDEFLKKFVPCNFGNIEILEEVYHITADDRKFLIVHGDCFDELTKHIKWLYFLGDNAYSFAMWLNHLLNKFRDWMGLPYWSLSDYLKSNVKKAVNYINNFENVMVNYAKQKECVGVIAGHIHCPSEKDINGIMYYNCGDWIENRSAIIEDFDGKISLINLK